MRRLPKNSPSVSRRFAVLWPWAFMLAPLILGGCSGGVDKGPAHEKDAPPVYRHYDSFREIPGVTGAEIAAVEAILRDRDRFSYGMTFSTEAFRCEEEGSRGFAVLFCHWLSELFDVPFDLVIYDWDELLETFDSRGLDFSGEMEHQWTEEIPYYHTEIISPRVLKTMRIGGQNGKAAFRYGVLKGTGFDEEIAPYLRNGSEIITVRNYGEAYSFLKEGRIDIFVDDESAEASFDQYGDVNTSMFFPLVHSPVTFATANPDLAPIISVVQKYLEQGASTHLEELRRKGRREYLRWKLYNRLTEEEKRYIQDQGETSLKVALARFNYPGSFYNERERRWQGVFPSVLEMAGELTGIRFEPAHLDEGETPEALLGALKVSMIAVPLSTRERDGPLIWVDAPYLIDHYALLSRHDYPDVDAGGIASSRVGLVVPSVYADVFRQWFPVHGDVKGYNSMLEGFNALENGKIDLLMASHNAFTMMINYYARAAFKINYYFDQSYYSRFGFNHGDGILASIIGKAQDLIDTSRLTNYWSRRLFDYRKQVEAARQPLIISAALLIALVFTLLVALLARNIKNTERLEEMVRRRTGELARQTNLAQAANVAKSRFLASMSHEIRTPMNAIIGMSDLMRTDNLDETQQNYFSDIKDMAKSLLQIINDILDLSKIEAGKMDIVPVHFNILGLYDNICSFNEFGAKAKDLCFSHSIDRNIPSVIYADEGRVRQVVTNILNNAIKYTREGSVNFKVEQKTRGGKDWLSFTVTDTGIGIKRENFSQLFDNFQQFDREKNYGTVGTGLGLAITKNLVEMMDGEIFFDSEYGKGSVFTIQLPLVEGESGKVEQVGATARVFAKEGTHVLVVDDNSINLNVALGFLAAHHIKADTVTSGMAAVERVQEKRYDMVFMDQMMPGMDGIETTQAIRNLGSSYDYNNLLEADSAIESSWYQKMPIVALSANAMSGARESFIAAGMNDFIAKPIVAEELNAMLLKWLPPDKIITTGPESQTGGDTGRDGGREAVLLAEIAGIEGFDTAAGLSHTRDNAAAYLGILRQFCNEYDGYEAEINQYLAAENWKDYAIKLHAMKGVFATIGMDSLSQWARKLELAAKSGDTATCKNETAGICRAMRAFIDRLAGTSLVTPEETGPRIKVEAAALEEKLAQLREACMKGDCDFADALAAEIAGMSLDPETDRVLAEVCSLAASLDYDAAIEKIHTVAWGKAG